MLFRKQQLKKFFLSIILLLLILLLSIFIFTSCSSSFGNPPTEEKQKEYEKSPNFHDGTFHNIKKVNPPPSFFKMMGILWDMMLNDNITIPEKTFQVMPFNISTWDSIPTNQFAMSWLGHSTIIMKVNGKNIITDPVFSERVSPVSFSGPKHFSYSHRLNLNDLPTIDVVLISHDHYDHLDEEVIKQLSKTKTKFYVPLGVESHLQFWGVDTNNIVCSDWWQDFNYNDQIQFAFVPSQHFSGRGLTDRMCTLWGSWIIKTKENNIFFSGDSGYHKEFKTIGEKYGPFDITFIECGAYNKEWKDIHMFPEQSYQAALDLNSSVVMPIHWGKYNLAMHNWYEPVEKIKTASIGKSSQLITPEINMIFLPKTQQPQTNWWKNYKQP